MTVNMSGFPRSAGRRITVLLLLLTICTGAVVLALAVDPAILLGSPCGTQPQLPQIVYSAKLGETVNTQIPVKGAPGYTVNDVFWELSSSTGCTNVGGSLHSIDCGPNVFDVIAPAVQVSGKGSAGWPVVTSVTIGNEHLNKPGIFKATVAEAPDGDPICSWDYLLRAVSNGGGWGDPHLTTVDGVHYDFQSAGEFTALREKDLELQTRQAAVPTTSVPSANPYTGLATCVAIYTAVAVRVGANRVTLQPNISGRPDPSGLQIRVNGQLVTLPDQGIDLLPREGGAARQSEARIVRAAGGSIEIVDWRGTQIVVTPTWWASQSTWYLDVNVYQTSANLGTMGALPKGSWLPALPDGTAFGPKPATASQRYQDLYEKFADAWRVTDTTSLFDYTAGTSTKDFTLDEWPRLTPPTCEIKGQKPAGATTPQLAAKACAGISDPIQRDDCIFDVTSTGHTGFADGYKKRMRFEPRGTGWQTPLKAQSKKPWWRGLIFWDRDRQ